MKRCMVLMVVVMMGAGPKPATTAASDGSGARAALLMYDKMVGPHDWEKALGLYHATSTRERALAECLAKMDGELAHLYKVASSKYGKEIGLAMVSSVGAKTISDINGAKITVKGEVAEVLFPGDEEPTIMRRVNGDWKVDMKRMIQALDVDLRRFRQAIERLAGEVDRLAEQIGNGQFATAEKPSALLLEAKKRAFAGDEGEVK